MPPFEQSPEHSASLSADNDPAPIAVDFVRDLREKSPRVINLSPCMNLNANKRIALVAGLTVFFDHLTKLIVLKYLSFLNEKVIVPGFFKFVHWGNTGAAWSMFNGNNELLAIVSLVALLVLFIFRRHFDTRTILGQISMGLIFGGIIGNLIDRLFRKHVIDFIYFYLQPRGGREIGFPAFNIADTAICTGVGLLFLISWRQEMQGRGGGENLARNEA
jgi:signal peptidase II